MGWLVNATPRPTYLRESDLVSIVQEVGGLQGRSGQRQKISPLQGFDPRTIQPVASRCIMLFRPTPTDVGKLKILDQFHNVHLSQ